MERWITDTPNSERFPYYTRANADEVGPDPFSVLGWSMVWMRGCNPGVAMGFVEFGVVDVSEYDLTPLQVFGNRGGYFYNPMSLSRLMGERMPGATAEAIDKAYFGDHPGVPPYEPHPGDVNEAQSAKLAETMGWVMSTPSYPRMHDASKMAMKAVTDRPDFTKLSNAELVDYARRMTAKVEEAWIPYTVVCLGASLGPGAVQAVCEGIGRSEDAVKVLSAVGNVESAEASFSMWDISRLVNASPSLTAAFDAGVDGLLARLDRNDAANSAFYAAWDELMRVHGHRAPNEWDCRPDSWTTKPEIALGMIDRLRAAGVIPDHHHIFNLLDEELDEFLVDPSKFSAVIAEREVGFQELHQLEPPYIVGNGRGDEPVHTWPRRNAVGGEIAKIGDVLQGGPGAPGVITGRARIVLDPMDAPDMDPTDILVAPTTDPSWAPLFLSVGGVVVNVGAVGSHAAIVSRELG
ncbi:MAG: hypothetical protein EBY07_04010, partial [Actinobacteria bacterium]|nr:hypothetical protein [Actinomycetota bacterium]